MLKSNTNTLLEKLNAKKMKIIDFLIAYCGKDEHIPYRNDPYYA
jgi:hypothetical protein